MIGAEGFVGVEICCNFADGDGWVPSLTLGHRDYAFWGERPLRLGAGGVAMLWDGRIVLIIRMI